MIASTNPLKIPSTAVISGIAAVAAHNALTNAYLFPILTVDSRTATRSRNRERWRATGSPDLTMAFRLPRHTSDDHLHHAMHASNVG
jgi:hypothetical protein